MRLYAILFLALPIAFATSSCALIGVGVGTAISLLPLKLLFNCLPEGTKIDTPEGSQAVETLVPGDLVIGFEGRPVKVLQIHAYAEDATKDNFLKVEFEDGAVVDLCDLHRIDGKRSGDLKAGDELKSGHIVKTISSYDGVERSYDILTEDKGYRIGGVPVNSMIEEMYETGHRGGKLKR